MSEIEELRDKIEALEIRIERLEERDDTNHTETKENGLDHRDEAVVEHLTEGTNYSGRTLVKKYLTHTDIVNNKTAQQRAKRLHNKDLFENHIYVGWDA